MADIAPPPRRIMSPIAAELRRELLDALDGGKLQGNLLLWLEKVRRFASYAGRNLANVARQRFGRATTQQLEWMIEFLVEGGARHPDRGAGPIDPACLSAALYCLDVIDASPRIRAMVDEADRQLRESLLSGARADAPPCLGSEYRGDTGRWADEAATCRKLVLFSPNPFSLYSVAVLELCLRYSLPVEAVVLRSFSVKRFLSEWRRDGLRLISKIWRNLVLRSDENADAEGLSLKQLVASLTSDRDVREIARKRSIPVLKVDEFCDSHEKLRELCPDAGLFTGGGMVGAETLALFSRGIINLHLGHLPHYKGMDVVETPVLEGRRIVGATAHLMVPALDAGPVLVRMDADAARYSSIGALRNSLGCLMPFVIVDSVMGLFSGRLQPIEQPAPGRQFFFTHRRLDEAMKAAFAAGASAQPDIMPLEDRLVASLATLRN